MYGTNSNADTSVRGENAQTTKKSQQRSRRFETETFSFCEECPTEQSREKSFEVINDRGTVVWSSRNCGNKSNCRFFDLTEEEKEKLRGSYKVSKKLDNLERMGEDK